MENTFENAEAYMNSLKDINKEYFTTDKAIATAMVSYAAKCDNGPIKEMISKFRIWEREWNLFCDHGNIKQPLSIDEFIKSLEK